MRKALAVLVAGMGLAATLAASSGSQTGDCIPLIVTATYGQMPDGTHVAVGTAGSSTVQEYGDNEKQISPPDGLTDLKLPCTLVGVIVGGRVLSPTYSEHICVPTPVSSSYAVLADGTRVPLGTAGSHEIREVYRPGKPNSTLPPVSCPGVHN
jgi:hypothetical protein